MTPRDEEWIAQLIAEAPRPTREQAEKLARLLDLKRSPEHVGGPADAAA